MQILLRRHDGNDLVWTKANYHECGFVLPDCEIVSEAQVMSVVNDNSKNYVICSNCGEIIRNTPEAIAEHMAKYGRTEVCLECVYKVNRYASEIKRRLVRKADGTYVEKTERAVTLGCGRTWSDDPVESERARNMCKYKECSIFGVKEINSIFVRYPGLFDDMLTVGALSNINFVDSWNLGGMSTYRLNANIEENVKIYAATNKLGIVMHFIVQKGSREMALYYSKKYDMLFHVDCNVYLEATNCFDEDVMTAVRNFIRNLYR